MYLSTCPAVVHIAHQEHLKRLWLKYRGCSYIEVLSVKRASICFMSWLLIRIMCCRMCFGIHRALFLPVCPTIRDEIHTWEPMSPCWCVANHVLSASQLFTCFWGQQLPAWSCATPMQWHTSLRTRGHTLLHPIHIFLPHQIHFHDSLEHWLSTGGLWTKNGSQVCSGLMANSRKKSFAMCKYKNVHVMLHALNLEDHEQYDAM